MRKNARHSVAAADIESAWKAVYAQSMGHDLEEIVADGWMNTVMFAEKFGLTLDTARHMLDRNANLERRSFRVQTEKSVRQVNFYRPKKS